MKEEIKLVRSCCRTHEEENHAPGCSFVAGVDASHAKDYSGERWKDSYIINNTENLRKRALARQNGHG